MNEKIFSKTLGINEDDVKEIVDIQILKSWKFTIKKDIINMSEKYDQNINPLLLRDSQDPKEAAVAAHKALYAKEKQELLLELVIDKINTLE